MKELEINLSSWEYLPVRHLFDVINGSTPSSAEKSYWNGDIYWATPQDIGSLRSKVILDTQRKITEEGYKKSGTSLVPIDSIILTTRAPVGNLALAGVSLCTNQGCKALVPKQNTVISQYFYYQFLARKNELSALATGTTFQELGTEELNSFRLLLPPFSQQQNISDYLDRETQKIDALISVKQRLLELLAEKRRSLITHAVTHGLNDDVLMKSSGLHWIGAVPEHWKIETLKYHLSNIEQGWSPQSDSFPAELDEWGVLKVGAVNGWEFNPDENKRIPVNLVIPTEYEIRSGDILVSRANTTELVGSASLVKEVRPKLLLCDKLYRLIPQGNRLLPEYLVFYLRSISGRFEFERDASGASSSMQNISQATLANLLIPIPPIIEQIQIVKYINYQLSLFGDLEIMTAKAIALLQERRTSLISAAVTGQIEIPDQSYVSHSTYPDTY